MSRSRAYQLIDAAEVVSGLSTIVDTAPATESQARPLALEEDYCRVRWGMSRFYAHRVIEAAKVVENLLPIGNIPATESQARPLALLKDPDQQREAWTLAVALIPSRSRPRGRINPERGHHDSMVSRLRPVVHWPAVSAH